MERETAPMIEGPIASKIIRFAMPLLLGNLFQQLYNTADTIIVGNILGDSALAAVASTGSLVYLLVGFFQGLAVGAGVLIAQRCGAGDREGARIAIHTDLVIGVVFGVILMAIGVLGTPVFLRWMGTPESVMAQSTTYLQVYFAGGIGLVLYNVCMGIMQSLGDSRHPLYYLMVAAAINIPLDIVLISVFKMDVAGAAVATIFSQFLSAGLCLRRLVRKEKVYTVSFRELRIHWPSLRTMIGYGLPGGLQNSLISIANVVVQSQVNSFGEAAMAGVGAYAKIEGFIFLPVISFTAAITTFVGQNLGAGKVERTRKGARFGILCSMLIAEGIGMILYALSPILMRAFTSSPEAIAYGVERARVCGPFICLLAATHCLSATLRGAGKAMVPMVMIFATWCLFRMGFLLVVLPMVRSITVVSMVYPLTWAMSTLALLIYYKKVDWMHDFLVRSGQIPEGEAAELQKESAEPQN